MAFGSSGREFARTLIDAILVGDTSGALRTVEAASEAGSDLTVLTRSLIAGFRHLLVARIDAGLLAGELAPEDAERAVRQAASLSQTMLIRALRTFGEALSLVRGGGNARLGLETALLRFMISAEYPSLESLRARLAALEERAGGASLGGPGPAEGPISPALRRSRGRGTGKSPQAQLQRLASKGASRLAEHSIQNREREAIVAGAAISCGSRGARE